MKKKTRKLTLNRETLKNLSSDQLRGAAGGVTQRCTQLCSNGTNCASYCVSDCEQCNYSFTCPPTEVTCTTC